MITEWRLRNFKSVAEETIIPLAALTVLTGKNSSGKSTLLQSIRLMAQASLATGPIVPLNGPYIQLGRYDQLVSRFPPPAVDTRRKSRLVYQDSQIAGEGKSDGVKAIGDQIAAAHNSDLKKLRNFNRYKTGSKGFKLLVRQAEELEAAFDAGEAAAAFENLLDHFAESAPPDSHAVDIGIGFDLKPSPDTATVSLDISFSAATGLASETNPRITELSLRTGAYGYQLEINPDWVEVPGDKGVSGVYEAKPHGADPGSKSEESELLKSAEYELTTIANYSYPLWPKVPDMFVRKIKLTEGLTSRTLPIWGLSKELSAFWIRYGDDYDSLPRITAGRTSLEDLFRAKAFSARLDGWSIKDVIVVNNWHLYAGYRLLSALIALILGRDPRSRSSVAGFEGDGYPLLEDLTLDKKTLTAINKLMQSLSIGSNFPPRMKAANQLELIDQLTPIMEKLEYFSESSSLGSEALKIRITLLEAFRGNVETLEVWKAYALTKNKKTQFVTRVPLEVVDEGMAKAARKSYNPERPAFAEVVRVTKSFFKNHLHYLGPLRTEPRAVYDQGSLDGVRVGQSGGHTAASLHNNQYKQVQVVIPDSSSPGCKIEVYTTDLRSAVNHWARYLDVAYSVRTTDAGNLGIRLMVTRGPKEKFSELTHVGVGVSQLLPIIVQGLVAKRPDILLFEQPELHLHPKLQTKLADFFYALSRSGIQCIIETHSEHIINRLRHHAVAAADKREDQSNNHTLLYYADQDRQGTKYQPLTINEYGIIEDWPEGFFDEIENSSSLILKASMAKVRARREAERLSHTID